MSVAFSEVKVPKGRIFDLNCVASEGWDWSVPVRPFLDPTKI